MNRADWIDAMQFLAMMLCAVVAGTVIGLVMTDWLFAKLGVPT